MDELIFDEISSYLNNRDNLFLLDRDSNEFMSNIRKREEDDIVGSREIARNCGVKTHIYNKFLRRGSENKGNIDSTIALKLIANKSNWISDAQRAHFGTMVKETDVIVTFKADGNFYTTLISVKRGSVEVADPDGDYYPYRQYSDCNIKLYKNTDLIYNGDFDLVDNMDLLKSFIADKTGYDIDPILISKKLYFNDNNQSYMLMKECGIDSIFAPFFYFDVEEEDEVDDTHYNVIENKYYNDIIVTARVEGNSYFLHYRDGLKIYKNCQHIKTEEWAGGRFDVADYDDIVALNSEM